MKNKFTLGQEVYKITDGKIQEYEVLGMIHGMEVFKYGETDFTYYYQITFIDIKNGITPLKSNNDFVHEDSLYASRQELIANL